jgi:hypothetical protein
MYDNGTIRPAETVLRKEGDGIKEENGGVQSS